MIGKVILDNNLILTELIEVKLEILMSPKASPWQVKKNYIHDSLTVWAHALLHDATWKKNVSHSAERQEPLGQMFSGSPVAMRQNSCWMAFKFFVHILDIILCPKDQKDHPVKYHRLNIKCVGFDRFVGRPTCSQRAEPQQSSAIISTVIVRLVVHDTNLSLKNTQIHFSISVLTEPSLTEAAQRKRDSAAKADSLWIAPANRQWWVIRR